MLSSTSGPGATFSGYLANSGCHAESWEHNDSCFVATTATLTWDELKLAENGQKYAYDASQISDTCIGGNVFMTSNLVNIIIPNTITSAGATFFCCTSPITSITFDGTVVQWNAIELNSDFVLGAGIKTVICSDGTVTLE